MHVNLDRVQAIIVATAILHNIAIDIGEAEPPQETDDIDNEVPVPPVHVGNDTRRTQLINYFARL